jgi:7-carboxy-7-deazaguanine synthase
MRIAEIFHSIQGEGKLAGVPSVFIRTSGCNLRCTWCDTPYASWDARGWQLTVDQIVERVAGYDCRHVILTGGEPLIASGVEELSHRIRQGGHHLTIETAATIWRDVTCDLASMSPKLSNSTPWERHEGRFAGPHEKNRLNIEVIRRFISFSDYQLKFVVDRAEDVTEIEELLVQIGSFDRSNVLLMPQGDTQEQIAPKVPWIADLCKERGFRFCPRLQITLFGNTPGT